MKRKTRKRTQVQRVRRALMAGLVEVEETIPHWKPKDLITWLMPRIERTLKRRAREGGT